MMPLVSTTFVWGGIAMSAPIAWIFSPTTKIVPFAMTSSGVTRVPRSAYWDSCAFALGNVIVKATKADRKQPRYFRFRMATPPRLLRLDSARETARSGLTPALVKLEDSTNVRVKNPPIAIGRSVASLLQNAIQRSRQVLVRLRRRGGEFERARLVVRRHSKLRYRIWNAAYSGP